MEQQWLRMPSGDVQPDWRLRPATAGQKVPRAQRGTRESNPHRRHLATTMPRYVPPEL